MVYYGLGSIAGDDMSLEGTIVNGEIELDTPAELPEGTRVRVEPVPEELRSSASSSKVEHSTEQAPLTVLNKALLALSGRATGLPPDMSINHDHYIHGSRKRKP